MDMCIEQICFMFGVSFFIGALIIFFFRALEDMKLFFAIVLLLSAGMMFPTMYRYNIWTTMVFLSACTLMGVYNIYIYIKGRHD